MMEGALFYLALSAVLLAVAVSIVLRQTAQTLAYDKTLAFDDESCALLPLPTPAEDLSALGDGHCVFAGGGAVWQTFMHGAASVDQGGAVWLVNATRGTVEELKITGESAPEKLVLHGIYFSQLTRRLYAVNHGDEEKGEAVEVFDVVMGLGAPLRPLRLAHVASVRSPLFGHLALNDVVEGDPTAAADVIEFYVSEWRPLGGFPVGGKHAKDVPFAVRVRRALHVPLTLIKAPLTRVFRCTVSLSTPGGGGGDDDDGSCTVASSARFVGANGLAVSKDRRTVFVSDPPARTIRVLKREDGSGKEADSSSSSSSSSSSNTDSGRLQAVSQFRTKHVVDNIEMTADGRLSAGSIPLPYTSGSVCEEAPALAAGPRGRIKGAAVAVGGREVGCGRSPGGQLVISLIGTGGGAFRDGTQVDARMHDGSLLSGVSSAIPVESGKLIMGAPDHPGVLVCDNLGKRSRRRHYNGPNKN